MGDFFTATQQGIIDRDNRQMALAGIPMSQVLEDIKADIEAGNIGITADAADVDSLALDGGALGYSKSTTTGLNFGYSAGRVLVGQAVKTVAAGTILLSASSTNYVEVDPSGSGSVVVNTTAFTTGNVPLYVVVTGVSSVSTVTNMKVLLVAGGSGYVTGAMLSTAAKTKTREISLGALSATGSSILIFTPNHAATLSGAWLGVTTTVTADDTNYWTFSLVNKGAAGTGTTAMLAATAANTTQATGGSGLTANVARALTLHGTGANLVTAAKDALVFTATKTSAAANLVAAVLSLDFTYTG